MDLSAYSVPKDKPRRVVVRRRSILASPGIVEVRPVPAVDAATECHVTPAAAAARMVRYLGIGSSLLEPSAGTGNLVKAALQAGYPLDSITAVERHIKLSCYLREELSGLDVRTGDFLEIAPSLFGAFDRVLINPPFSKTLAHIKAALSCLKYGGRLVALVPVTFQYPGMCELERLPIDTFSTCKVATKIVSIEK